MATTIKRRKTGEELGPLNYLPPEVWYRIADFLPTAVINGRFSQINRNLQAVAHSILYSLKIRSGESSSRAWIKNCHQKTIISQNTPQTIRMLKEDRVRSLTLAWIEGLFEYKILSPIIENHSCRSIKIIGHINDDENGAHKIKCDTLLICSSKCVANKKIKDFHFEIFNSSESQDLLINKDAAEFLFETLSHHPLKTLRLNFDAKKVNVSQLLAPYLKNLKTLSKLEINGKLSLDFWKALKSHPAIKTLHLLHCDIEPELGDENEKIITDALLSLPQLQSLIISPDIGSPIVKCCVSAFANNLPAKLRSLKIVFYDSSNFSDYGISNTIREKFFYKIAQPQSPIRKLEVQDPYLFHHLQNAPWQEVQAIITNEDLLKLRALNERKEGIILNLDFKGYLHKIKNILAESVLPNFIKKMEQLGSNFPYQLFLSRDGNKKIMLTGRPPEDDPSE